MAEIVKGVNADWPDELEATRANLKAMSDAVEIQKAEIVRLRAALREIADDNYVGSESEENADWMRETARRALGQK